MPSTPVREKSRFLIFGAPLIEEEDIDAVVETMRSGWLGTGPRTARFEEAVARYKRSPYSVALNSCSAALHLSLLASGVGEGDEVITTAMTFCATVNAIIHAGATPVLADVDPATMNLSPTAVESAITPRTKAILPVHFGGRPCDMQALCGIAGRHQLKMIEDCAHAIETEYHGRSAGTFGDFGCLSFYVTKNVVTGEGGMVLTCSEANAERIKVLALHGMNKDAWRRFSDEGYKHYLVTEAGFKYNMMDLQAAIGIGQLARVEQSWRRRQAIWTYYNAAFRDLPVTCPSPPEPETRHGFHLYTLLIDAAQSGISRDDFLDRMEWNNIGVGVHYLSLAEHPYYRERFGWTPEAFPQAMKIGRQTVSLPNSAKLTDEDVHDVIDAVRTSLGFPPAIRTPLEY